MDLTQAEAKITIAKLIEVSYAKDKETTVKILAKLGTAQLSVDQNGNATLTSSAGFLTFSGNQVLNTIGAKIKRISVDFNNIDGERIGYTASFDLEYLELSVSGSFNLKTLITSCSGLLCIAARALQGKHHAYNMELQRIMGQ